jgi:RNA polymerase sigma-70 factor (ECF subfamily)
VDPSLLQNVDRARHGDTAAFDAVVREFEAPLVRFVAAVLAGDVHAANDVVQDVFVAAWRALPGLSDPEHLAGWLYRVAYRRAVSRRRRRGPRGLHILDLETVRPDGATHADHCVAREATPAEACATAEVLPHLRAVLGRMPPRYAAPLTLHHLEGLGLRETARLLGLAVPTVKMRLFRARRLLRARLLSRETWTRHRPAADRIDPLLADPVPTDRLPSDPLPSDPLPSPPPAPRSPTP